MKKRVISMIVCMAIMLGCMDTIVFGYSFSALNEIEDGVYIIVSAIDENMVLDISGQSKDDGGNVHLWTRHSGNSQKFSISKNGDYYSIVNVNSGKALCIKGDSNKSGANVHQWRIHSGDSQKWKFEFKSGGYVKIKSKLGNYLDASDGKSENGTNIQVYKSNDTDAQRWLLLKCPEKSTGKTPAEQAKNDLISLYEYEINDTVRLYMMMNEFMEADKFKLYSSAIKQGISSAVSILLKPLSNGKNGFAVVEELNDDADKKASIIFANTLSQTEAEFFSDFGSTVKYGKNFSNVAKSANTLNEMFNKSKNTAKDKEKVIEEFAIMLQKDFPGLITEEKAKEVLQKMSNTDFLEFFDKTIDIADFCNNLMMYTSIYSTDIEICKEYMQRCPATDSFIYIKLKDIVERLERNYVEFLFDEFLIEEGIEKIDKGLWKIIAANPYGLHAKNVLSLIDTANMVVFDYIVKAPSYSSMNLDLALYNYRNMFDNSFMTKERIQNLKSTYSPDSAIEFAKDFLVLVNITNELLENSKSFAKYNKKFGTAFVNLQIAKCETLKEKILAYVEIIEKDKTTEKNIIVPGPMTSTSSKKEYTTDENVVINWTESSNASEYGLTIIRDEDNETVFNGRVTGNSKNIGKLDAGTYRFNMRGYNSVGKGELSKINRFTVKDDKITQSVVKYSDWSEWSTIPVSATSTRQVESKKQYGYYHYVFDISDGQGAYPVDMKFFNECKIGTASNSRYHEYWSDNKLPVLSGTLTYYSHARKERHTFEKYNNKCCSDDFSFANRANYLYYLGERTVYRYRDIVEEKNENTTIMLTINSNYAIVCGKKVYNDVAPVIENNRTMLPARFVAENLGATVSWDDTNQKVTIKGADGTKIEIYVNSSTAYVNGVAKTLDSPAFIRNSRTYTPVRFICDSLGADVQWDDVNRKVTITK